MAKSLSSRVSPVIELLQSTDRKGMDELLKCMDDGGYFTTICHSHHHYTGGLAEHSLSACRRGVPYVTT